MWVPGTPLAGPRVQPHHAAHAAHASGFVCTRVLFKCACALESEKCHGAMQHQQMIEWLRFMLMCGTLSRSAAGIAQEWEQLPLQAAIVEWLHL